MSTTIPKAIICDLDGTLADHRHRLKFVDPAYNKKFSVAGWGGPDCYVKTGTTDRFVADYEAFYAGMDKDGVNEWCSRLLWQMAQEAHHQMIQREYGGGCELLFVSGRPQKYRQVSENQIKGWVEQPNSVEDWMVKWKLFMRPDFLPHEACPGSYPHKECKCLKVRPDHRPSHEVKREIYQNEIAGKYEVLFALEDSLEDATMYRDLGLTVLVCK